MNKLIKILQRLDILQLESLAGQTIVKAVESAYEVNREKELARLVVDRYGTEIFKQRNFRKAIIKTLETHEAKDLCGIWGKSILGSDLDAYLYADSIFSKTYNVNRVTDVINYLGLSDELIPRNIIDNRPTSEIISPKYGEQIVSKGIPHPYQLKIKDKSNQWLREGVRKFIIQMPTGAGKTITALELFVDKLRLQNANGLIIWIVNSTELAEQTLQAFNILWRQRGDRAVSCHRFFGKFTPNFSEATGIVFANFDKANEALNSENETNKNNFRMLCEKAELVIVDEAHTSVAETYSRVIRFLTNKDAPLIGLTATPGRNDPVETEELARIYGEKLLAIDVDDETESFGSVIDFLRSGEYLADTIYEELDSDISVDGIDEDLICKKLAENSDRNKKIITQIERAVELKDSTIVFSCTKDHVFALVALCRSRNIDVDFIVGETSQHKRIEILNRFKSKELLVLINHEILSTGIDVPNINRLIITRPVGSAILYSQMIGRALRGPRNGGNKSNTIVNIKDNLFQFPTASLVFEAFKNNFITTRA